MSQKKDKEQIMKFDRSISKTDDILTMNYDQPSVTTIFSKKFNLEIISSFSNQKNFKRNPDLFNSRPHFRFISAIETKNIRSHVSTH